MATYSMSIRMRIQIIVLLMLIMSPFTVLAQLAQEEMIVSIVRNLSREGSQDMASGGITRWSDLVRRSVQEAWTLEAQMAVRQTENVLTRRSIEEIKSYWFYPDAHAEMIRLASRGVAREEKILGAFNQNVAQTLRSRDDLVRMLDQEQWVQKGLISEQQLTRIRNLNLASQSPADVEEELRSFMSSLDTHSLRTRILSLQELPLAARNLTLRTQANWAFAESVYSLRLQSHWWHVWTNWKKLPHLAQQRIANFIKRYRVYVKTAEAPVNDLQEVNQISELNKIMESLTYRPASLFSRVHPEPQKFTLFFRDYVKKMIEYNRRIIRTELETLEALSSISPELELAVSKKIQTDSFYLELWPILGRSHSITDLMTKITQYGNGNLEAGIESLLKETRGSYNPLSSRAFYIQKWMARKAFFGIAMGIGYIANSESVFEAPPFGEEPNNPEPGAPVDPSHAIVPGGKAPDMIDPSDLGNELGKIAIAELKNAINQLTHQKKELILELQTVTDPVERQMILEEIQGLDETIEARQADLDAVKKKLHLNDE